MDPKQEPKYRAVAPHYPENDGLSVQLTQGYLINRRSGERIPDDEPVFVFRARDTYARAAIANYLVHLVAAGDVSDEHKAAVQARVDDFKRFAVEHPERMKTPD